MLHMKFASIGKKQFPEALNLSTVHTIRTTDDDARALAQGLVRASPFASLATLSQDSFPLATLSSIATDMDGSPLILVSRLSGHTTNLLADPRCSLLFQRTGKGDPLAHPRISVKGLAGIVERASVDGHAFRRRFLARQPKSELYIDFPDFLFLHIKILSASLNGGFGKAFELEPPDLLTETANADTLREGEAEIIAHMNDDHADAVQLFATRLARREPGAWRIVSVDPGGFEIAAGAELSRIAFAEHASTPDAVRMQMVRLANEARAR